MKCSLSPHVACGSCRHSLDSVALHGLTFSHIGSLGLAMNRSVLYGARLLARAILALLLVFAPICAQSGDAGVDAAVDFLSSVGESTPDGFSVQTTDKGPLAITHTDGSGGGVININVTALEAKLEEAGGSLTPGVLVIVLYHEYKHADGSFQDDSTPCVYACQERDLQRQVAAKHCEFLCYVLSLIPDADISAGCAFYKLVQDVFSNGKGGQFPIPAASKVYADCGCAGGYPGDIPDCECCP